MVDDLIDYIEERIALDLSPDAEPVIYEVGDWPQGLEERFLELLIENRIPHNRGYREVTVGVDDEERVDDLVEEVTSAWEDEQPTDEELDGPDAQEVLSELFVSSDRLMHDASDRAATVRFDDAAESALAMGLPFGFDQARLDRHHRPGRGAAGQAGRGRVHRRRDHRGGHRPPLPPPSPGLSGARSPGLTPE